MHGPNYLKIYTQERSRSMKTRFKCFTFGHDKQSSCKGERLRDPELSKLRTENFYQSQRSATHPPVNLKINKNKVRIVEFRGVSGPNSSFSKHFATFYQCVQDSNKDDQGHSDLQQPREASAEQILPVLRESIKRSKNLQSKN